MFNAIKLAEIQGRLKGLDQEGSRDRADIRQLEQDVRSLDAGLSRLLDYLKLEEKWTGAQIVPKKKG